MTTLSICAFDSAPEREATEAEIAALREARGRYNLGRVSIRRCAASKSKVVTSALRAQSIHFSNASSDFTKCEAAERVAGGTSARRAHLRCKN